MVLTCLVVVPRLRRRWGDGWSSSTRSGPWKLSQSSDRSWWISPPHPAMDCSVKCPLLRSVVTNLGRKISPISIKFWIYFTVHSLLIAIVRPCFLFTAQREGSLTEDSREGNRGAEEGWHLGSKTGQFFSINGHMTWGSQQEFFLITFYMIWCS